MTTTLYQEAETRAVKEARLTRLSMEYHLVIQHHRKRLPAEPTPETSHALELCGFVVFPITYPNLDGLTIWFAMEKGQHRRAALLAREREIIADELQAPRLYGQLVEEMANIGPRREGGMDATVREHCERLESLVLNRGPLPRPSAVPVETTENVRKVG